MSAPRQEKRTAKWHRKEAEYYRLKRFQAEELRLKELSYIIINSDDKVRRIGAFISYKLIWIERLLDR